MATNNRQIEKAKDHLHYYFRLLAVKSGAHWDYENDAEIDQAIDMLVSGIVQVSNENADNQT